MGFLGRIEDWLEKRKQENHTKEKIFNNKRRKNIWLVELKEPCVCGSKKAWNKGSRLKCNRCAAIIK